MKKPTILLTALLFLLIAVQTATADGRKIFIDSTLGNDRNDGFSEQTPWRSIEMVNNAHLLPGDSILFKRGETWRGQLTPQSGKEDMPITYGAYGAGAKPLFLGSFSRDEPEDWHHEGGNIWTTSKSAWTVLETRENIRASEWVLHYEDGARVLATILSHGSAQTAANMQIKCTKSGTKANHIQLYYKGLRLKKGDYYEFRFRARSSKPFVIRSTRLIKASLPWNNYSSSSSPNFNIGPEWMDYSLRFQSSITADDGRVTIYLGDVLPQDSFFSFQPVSWLRIACNDAGKLSSDVGNIILDHGKSVGVKKWTQADLKQNGDYWYNADSWQVKFYSDKNPALRYGSVELALSRNIVAQSGKSHIVYEDIALSYGAAHGFGGAGTHHIVIRNCDISYIGGGHQFTTYGHRVRYGNGVEFWGDSHDNLVEGCRIWEVYDAALTNQGDGVNSQINIIYRNNVIWNCEYSFEYWNNGQASITRNIRFENNTCVNAGYGWGHSQRPDPKGCHLMFYYNAAKTNEFYIQNNIFYNSTAAGMWIMNDWTAGLTMDHNCWFQLSGPLVSFLTTSFTSDQFADFQKRTGLDAHSIFANPKFVNEDDADFRLAYESAARSLAIGAGSVGSQLRLQ